MATTYHKRLAFVLHRGNDPLPRRIKLEDSVSPLSIIKAFVGLFLGALSTWCERQSDRNSAALLISGPQCFCSSSFKLWTYC